MMYQIFRNDRGEVDAVNVIETGATVPTWDESDPLTIDFRSYCQQHPELDISDRSPLPEPEQPPQPNLPAFRVDMLMDMGYQRITIAAASQPAGILLVTRLENAFSFDSPAWGVIEMLWNQIINILPEAEKPTQAEAERWQGIATACNLSAIAFDGTGALILR